MNHPAREHPTTHCDGDGCVSGKRNRFFHQKIMRADEFRLEQAYGIERRRLVNRAVLGWGVVQGLGLEGVTSQHGRCDDSLAPPPWPVDETPQGDYAQQAQQPAAAAATEQTLPVPSPGTAVSAGTLTVAPGLALDTYGREIVLVERIALSPDNTFLRTSGASGCATESVANALPGRYVLAVHYAERRMGEAYVRDGCDCSRPEKNFVCETAVFSLRPLGECPCECGEPPCPHCDCACDACKTALRATHACMCHWTTNAKVAGPPGRLCDWNGYEVDPHASVDLACVTLSTSDDKCKPLVFTAVDDACGPRRLVKNNQLLYDLMRGCDLTRIDRISWGAWHRSPDLMPWKTFTGLLGTAVANPDDQPTVKTGLHVHFSGPVQVRTVTPDCFAIRFIVTGEDTGWYEKRLVPVVGVEPDARDPNDPPDTTRGVALVVQSQWQQEVLQRANKLRTEPATVHVEVYGDFILACDGQAIDASARGFALWEPEGVTTPPEPSGNGSPGGTFLSVFRIAQWQRSNLHRP